MRLMAEAKNLQISATPKLFLFLKAFSSPSNTALRREAMGWLTVKDLFPSH